MNKTRFVIPALLVVCFAWLILSYYDIIADNCTTDPAHHTFNLFVLMFGR